MGVDPFTILSVASAVSGGLGFLQQRKAQKQAERDAALQRASLASIQGEEKPVIPTADDEAVRRARRRSIAAQLGRRGRASTILTNVEPTDALGSA